MEKANAIRTIVLLWLAWAIILIGFQVFATARVEVSRPDYALSWTPGETGRRSQNNKPYLLDPFLNQQVSWDSEFYIAIAVGGYDDPQVRRTSPSLGTPLSLSYAFFPLYPYSMRIAAFPLRWLGLSPAAAATLAGVIVSLLGTLAALFALYDLAREELGESGAQRAAFYLLIFPAGFFLAMVYTEGLFVGLAFGSLALIRRRHLGWAALAAAAATWTRAAGIGLVIPLALAWWQEMRENDVMDGKMFVRGLYVAAPVAAYFVWQLLLGSQFDAVQRTFFTRGLLLLDRSLINWQAAWASLWGDNPQAQAYYAVEFAAMLLALAACFLTLKRYPGIALFGLFVIVVSVTSGPAQGMHRYVLAVPSLFLALARWGKSPVFDRAWTLASSLVMGLFAYLFAFDFWAG